MILFSVSPALARVQRLEPLLVDLLKNSKKIQGVQTDYAAQQDRLKSEKGKMFPILDVTANTGFEEIDGEGLSSDSDLNFNEVGLKFTQTLWDFGATLSDIRKGKHALEIQHLLLKQQINNTIVDGITVFLEVKRASIALDYAKRSELNIKRQAKFSEVMLAEGAGLSSDIIEVRKQLATAQTKLFNAELAMVTQINKFKKVFASTPVDFESFENLDFSILSHVPSTIYDVISRVENNNLDIKLAGIDIENAKEDSFAYKSRSFFPKVEAVLEKKWKHNVGGTLGDKSEFLGKVELSMPISFGFTEAKEYMATVKDKESLVITMESLREDIVEEARNAWHKLIASTMIWKSIKEQADLAAESLQIAYSESKFGIGSKTKTMNSETALLTAQSDAESARVDILLDAISLLNLMGEISIDILFKKESPEDLAYDPIPIFHGNFSLKPSDKVVAILKKIVSNANETPESADSSYNEENIKIKDEAVNGSVKKAEKKVGVKGDSIKADDVSKVKEVDKPANKSESSVVKSDIAAKDNQESDKVLDNSNTIPQAVKGDDTVKAEAEEKPKVKEEIDEGLEADDYFDSDTGDRYNPDTMLTDEELEIERLYSVPSNEPADEELLPKELLPAEPLKEDIKDLQPDKQLKEDKKESQPTKKLKDNNNKKGKSSSPTYGENATNAAKPHYEQPTAVIDEVEAEKDKSPAYEVNPNQAPAYEVNPNQAPAYDAEPNQAPSYVAVPNQAPAYDAEQ
ncbi:MAG: TolC family protein [Magnetococcales bacterium]|nr:TolC family protein [Magnetococcales bacterium]